MSTTQGGVPERTTANVSVNQESPSSVTLTPRNSNGAVVKLDVKVNGKEDPFKDIKAEMEKLRAEQKYFMNAAMLLLKKARPVNVTSHTQFFVSYHPVKIQPSGRNLSNLSQLPSQDDDANFDTSENGMTHDAMMQEWNGKANQFLERLERDIKNSNYHSYALRRLEAIEELLNTQDEDGKRSIRDKVIDEKYKNTRLMGETPLFIAALSFDNEMVDELINNRAKVSTIVSGGNTVFHFLVRYAYLYPENQTDVQLMMIKLNNALQTEGKVNNALQNGENVNNALQATISLWHTANDEGQTVLQSAALLRQHELFMWILQLKDIYLKYYKYDDLIDCVRFDVNEIDYVALNHFRNSKPGIRTNKIEPVNTNPNRAPPPDSTPQNNPQGLRPSSVTEIICEKIETEKALQFINIPLFDEIWKKKWVKYQVWFYWWLALHVVSMSFITAQAVIKAHLINANQQLLSTTQATIFVYIVSVLLFANGVLYIVLEFVSVNHRCMPRVLRVPRNGDYHGLLVVLSLCLVVDAIWVWVQGPQNNYLLAIALIIGGWFCTFFLRPYKIFSVFTTIVRSALLGDGLRFAVIILFDFVAFSFAMYFLYLTTPGGPPAEFEHPGMSALTMFKLMIGVDDLEILTRAPSPWLTVTLFIIFVVLTYILMFNILTAIMTDTTKKISKKGELQWKLQRLAVVVMIEKMLPLSWACNSAEVWDKNTQRFLSTVFYFEKDVQCILQGRKKPLKDKNKGDNSELNTSGVPSETPSDVNSHGTSPTTDANSANNTHATPNGTDC